MGAEVSGAVRWRKVTINGVDLWPSSPRLARADEPIVQDWEGFESASWDTPTGPRVGRDGNWSGTPRREPKSYMVKGITTHPDEYAADAWIDRLNAACIGKDLPLTYHQISGPRTALVRVPQPKIARPQPTLTEWQLSPVADDPSFYLGDGINPAWTATTTRTHEVGGLTFPIVFPLVFDSTLVAGQLEYRNPGTTGRLQFRLDGPLTDPLIRTTNSLGTRTLAWNITIPAGGWLLIDPQARTAKLNGQSSRPPVQRGWPTLTSGLHTFRFHAFGDSSGTLTTYAWPAY